ncbi:hypothetical protein D3C80_1885950 [compost metagenome]
MQQYILHVELVRLIPREREVQPCQLAVVEPALQLIAAQQVMGPVALAEQQPVTLLTGIDASLEQTA